MPKPYSQDLRKRVVDFVEAGHSRRAAARHFDVSLSFVVNLMTAYRLRGSLVPSRSADAATPSSIRTARFFSLAGGKERHHHAGIGGRA